MLQIKNLLNHLNQILNKKINFKHKQNNEFPEESTKQNNQDEPYIKASDHQIEENSEQKNQGETGIKTKILYNGITDQKKMK